MVICSYILVGNRVKSNKDNNRNGRIKNVPCLIYLGVPNSKVLNKQLRKPFSHSNFNICHTVQYKSVSTSNKQ